MSQYQNYPQYSEKALEAERGQRLLPGQQDPRYGDPRYMQQEPERDYGEDFRGARSVSQAPSNKQSMYSHPAFASQMSLATESRGFRVRDALEEEKEKLNMKPETYMMLSLFSILLNPVFGICALYYSCKAKDKFHLGKKKAGFVLAKRARFLAIAGIIVTFVLLIVAIGVLVHVSKIMIDICGDYFCYGDVDNRQVARP